VTGATQLIRIIDRQSNGSGDGSGNTRKEKIRLKQNGSKRERDAKSSPSNYYPEKLKRS
jgi:hypothetical protein